MTKEEIIEFINKKKPRYRKYLSSMSNEQKLALVNEWYESLRDVPVESVAEAFRQHERVSRYFPYVRELNKYIDGFESQADPIAKRWYSHLPKKGEVVYNDKDVEWATWDDWNNIPEELARRMKFEPDPSEPERLELLKEIQEMQLETFGESSVDEAIREAEIVQNMHICRQIETYRDF